MTRVNKPKTKQGLPPSGLAEDILRMVADGNGTPLQEAGPSHEPHTPNQIEQPSEPAQSAPPVLPLPDGNVSEPSKAEGSDDVNEILHFADTLAQPAGRDQQESAKEQWDPWVTFFLAGEVFGLPVSSVQEILRIGAITRVPHAPYPIRGVANMRGRVLPVVDLRVRLGLQEAPVDVRSRILVASSQNRILGILVDAAHEVTRFSTSRIQALPNDIMTEQSGYITGVYQLKEHLVILLDVDRVLQVHQSFSQINHAQNIRGTHNED